MIIGIGVDIVENARVGELLEKHGESFERKVFTEGELDYANDRRRRVEHLAVRFAAKEAASKALGRGMSNGISWRDIEVIHDDTGKPELKLHGTVKTLAQQMGIKIIHLSLSHTDTHSIALAIAENTETPHQNNA